jgi:hypothetical protein
MGARTGTAVNTALGGKGNIQTPGGFSKVFQAIAKRFGEKKTKELMNEAILDRELFLEITKPPVKIGKSRLEKGLNVSLNSWLLSSGAIASMEEGINEEDIQQYP